MDYLAEVDHVPADSLQSLKFEYTVGNLILFCLVFPASTQSSPKKSFALYGNAFIGAGSSRLTATKNHLVDKFIFLPKTHIIVQWGPEVQTSPVFSNVSIQFIAFSMIIK